MKLDELGRMLATSGYFKDASQVAQAVVKVLAGRELGFGPIASMTGIAIVSGKVSIGANLMAAAVRRSGRYDYKVKELTDKLAFIEFYEIVGGKRELLGASAFTLEDAQRAGTQNLAKFARNMLFARAMSNGVKWFCPDVTTCPMYTPEELGAVVNEDGEIIDAAPVKQAPPAVVVPPAPVQDIGTLSIERVNAAYSAADWLVAHPTIDNADLAAQMREHATATGWVKPDDVKNATQARASFARYIEAVIIASGKTEHAA
jgi:hypothetical protein